jgi:hypothetical protein
VTCGLICCSQGQAVDISTVALGSQLGLSSCEQLQVLSKLVEGESSNEDHKDPNDRKDRNLTLEVVRKRLRGLRIKKPICFLRMIKMVHGHGRESQQLLKLGCFGHASCQLTCGLCKELLTSPRLTVQLPCGHMFHADYTCSLGYQMLDTNMKCPSCQWSLENHLDLKVHKQVRALCLRREQDAQALCKSEKKQDNEQEQTEQTEQTFLQAVALLHASPQINRKRRRSSRVLDQAQQPLDHKKLRTLQPSKLFCSLMEVALKQEE